MENKFRESVISTALKRNLNLKLSSLKKFMFLVVSVCIMVFLVDFSISSAAEKSYVIDEAGLISASDEKKLSEKIKEIQKEKFDVVILTVKSLDGKSAQDYADDYYDYNGYGYGKDDDGILRLRVRG